MGIDRLIKAEIAFRRKVKGDYKKTLKVISKESGISYSNMRLYVNNEDRSMSGKNLDNLAKVMGYELVLMKKSKD